MSAVFFKKGSPLVKVMSIWMSKVGQNLAAFKT